MKITKKKIYHATVLSLKFCVKILLSLTKVIWWITKNSFNFLENEWRRYKERQRAIERERQRLNMIYQEGRARGAGEEFGRREASDNYLYRKHQQEEYNSRIKAEKLRENRYAKSMNEKVKRDVLENPFKRKKKR